MMKMFAGSLLFFTTGKKRNPFQLQVSKYDPPIEVILEEEVAEDPKEYDICRDKLKDWIKDTLTAGDDYKHGPHKIAGHRDQIFNYDLSGYTSETMITFFDQRVYGLEREVKNILDTEWQEKTVMKGDDIYWRSWNGIDDSDNNLSTHNERLQQYADLTKDIAGYELQPMVNIFLKFQPSKDQIGRAGEILSRSSSERVKAIAEKYLTIKENN